MFPFMLCLLLFSAALIFAAPFNVTVDDQLGSLSRSGRNISYSEGWFGDGFSNCGQCRPPFRQAVNGTWTSSTYIPREALDHPKTATLVFNGTAVYVNCIIGPSTVTGVIGNVDITFSIDGLVGGTHVEPAPQQYIYLTAFKREGLSLGEHTLVIQNGRQNGQFDQVMMFLDSIIYTTDDTLVQETQPPSSESTPSPDTPSSTQQTSESRGVEKKPLIVAAVCASIGGFIVGLLAFWLSTRLFRSRSQSSPSLSPSSPQVPTPFQDFRPNPEPKPSPPTSAVPPSEVGTSSVSGRSNQLSNIYDIQRTSTRRSVGQTDITSPSGPPPSYYGSDRA